MNIEELKLLIEETDALGQVPLVQGIHGIGKSESVSQYAKSKNLNLEPLILSLMDTGDLLGIPNTIEVEGLSTTVWSSPDWYTRIVNYAWPTELEVKALVFNDEGLREYFEESNVLWKTEISRSEVNNLYSKYYNLPSNMLHILVQDNLQYLKGIRSVLFLDEFNRSQPDIQDASLQLILEKRLHSHVLPRVMGQDTLIVAAINPSGKQYNVSDFDPALLDRFVFCTLIPDLPSWKVWARANGVANVVIDFLTNHPSRFHYEPEEGKGTSPRTWVKMSDYLHYIKDKTVNGIVNYTKGRLGLSVGIEFITYMDSYKNTMTVEQLEKLICSTLRNEGPKANVEAISETIKEEVQKLDNTQLLSYVEYFKEHYINLPKADQSKPLLVMLYSLPLEVLSTVLKDCKTNDTTAYRSLASKDKELNSSELFLRLTRNLRNDN